MSMIKCSCIKHHFLVKNDHRSSLSYYCNHIYEKENTKIKYNIKYKISEFKSSRSLKMCSVLIIKSFCLNLSQISNWEIY